MKFFLLINIILKCQQLLAFEYLLTEKDFMLTELSMKKSIMTSGPGFSTSTRYFADKVEYTSLKKGHF